MMFDWQPNYERPLRHRPLGNRVLLRRIEDMQMLSPAGLVIPDTYKRGSVIYLVLAVGRGEWRRAPRSKKRVFIRPEVKPGEYVLSYHWQEAASYPRWHQPEYLDFADGRGRCIVDARFLLAKWQFK